MVRAVSLVRLAPWAGLAGSAGMTGCTLLASVAYRGSEGEVYTPLNHFVSELGEPGVSSLAVLFNGGLIVAGLCFGLFMVGLGQIRASFWGAASAGAGAIAGLSGSLVGVYPQHSGPHVLVASAFFFLASIAIGITSVDVLMRPDRRFPLGVALAGFAVVAIVVTFVWTYVVSGAAGETGRQPIPVRPGLDWSAILEWASIAWVVAWTAIAGASWTRASRVGAA